jgi:hypothetical protein
MKSQQAVAIRFVGRRVISSTCLFFGPLRARFGCLKSTQQELRRAARETFASSNVERDASPP